MNKSKLFSLILLAVISGISVPVSSNENPMYVFLAELHNICSYPIHVKAWSFSYATPLDVVLKAEEKKVVLTLYGLTNDTKDLESGYHSYGLAISSSVANIFLDWEKFSVILKKSEKVQDGGVIVWTIKDKSLCPGN